MSYDYEYENALRKVLTTGVHRGDRTGTGTRSLFGLQMRWNLAKGFPLITTKKVFVRGVVVELLWFLSGSTNARDLQAQGVHIWDEWADADGSLGPVYGAQWRSWGAWNGSAFDLGIDQIASLIEGLRRDPESRRHIVSAWNVSEIKDMALPPCHCLFQFYVADGKLSCQLYQRSADMFLGVPFNIASYALLTHMVAQQCGLAVGDFIWTGGDCHIYDNHLDQVHEQLGRVGYPYPTLILHQAPTIFNYRVENVGFINYQSHGPIKAPVAV